MKIDYLDERVATLRAAMSERGLDPVSQDGEPHEQIVLMCATLDIDPGAAMDPDPAFLAAALDGRS